MSEVITGTPVTASVGAIDPIEVNSGDSAPISFDELNEMEAKSKMAKKEAKSQVKDTAKEIVKELQKSGKTDEKQPKEAKAKVEGEEKDQSLETKNKPIEKKTFKGKLGEKDIDLDPETLIPVKIGGKEEMISLKELRNDRAGKVEWDKRFSELDKERRSFQSRTQGATEKIKAIFSEQDPEQRLVRMADYAGVDPVQFRQKFLDENIKLLEKWYTMSDAEKQADARDFENRLLRTKLESKDKDDKLKQQLGELDVKVKGLRETHKVPEEQFLSRYDELESLQSQGKFKGEITPEFIIESIVKDKLWDAAEQKLKALNHELPIERRSKILLDLVDNAHSQGLNAKDLQDVVEELFKKPSIESQVQEKAEQRDEFLNGKKSGKKPVQISESAMFDDIL